ncbi:MAG: DASS family sodium-coupled anion symporter [Acidobacteria bacterium]|nr:DASS family sodium-coupled anion symporter [Acidobacteriota bacterium]
MLRTLLFELEKRAWLVVSLLAVVAIQLSPTPSGLTFQGKQMLAIVLMAIILYITEPVPLPAVATLIVLLQAFYRIAPPQELARSLMSDSLLFIISTLVLAAAVIKQNLDQRLLWFLLKLTGPSVAAVLFGFVVVCSVLTSFLGESATASIMLPVALVLIQLFSEQTGHHPRFASVLLFAIAFGCAYAGIGTPSGGARNAIMLEYWDRLGAVQVSYLQWIRYGYPLLLVQIPLLYLVVRRSFQFEAASLRESMVLLRRRVRAGGRLHARDWLTILVLGVTILAWIFFSSAWGLGIPGIFGVSLMMILGILDWDDINHRVNWGVILLYAGSVSMGVGVYTSGAADWVGVSLTDFLNRHGLNHGMVLFFAVGSIAMAMASLTGTAATVAILGPVVLRLSALTHNNPVIMGMVLVVTSAAANFTPMSSPACTIVYGSGLVRSRDYLRVGWKMSLISFGLVLIFARFVWPHL